MPKPIGSRRLLGSLGAIAAALLALGSAGCERSGSDGDAPPSESAPGRSEAGKALAGLRAAANDRARVSVSEGRVSIVAREARRSKLLHALAKQVGFSLEGVRPPPIRLSFELDDATPEAALARLLTGVDYRCEYRFDPKLGSHVLARVVTEQVSADAARAARGEPKLSADGKWIELGRFRRPVDTRTPEERARERAEAAALDAAAVALLSSASADERVRGLGSVAVYGPGRAAIFELARGDADPAVRAAALRRLQRDDSDEALDAQHTALTDPSPIAVRAALSGIIAFADPRSVPHLQRLLEAGLDPELRPIAQDALEFVE